MSAFYPNLGAKLRITVDIRKKIEGIFCHVDKIPYFCKLKTTV